MITIKLNSGIVAELQQPTGKDLSRAGFKHSTQVTEFDIVPFLMTELILINGKKEELQFFLDLSIDDYMMLVEPLGELMQTFKIFQ